jgi:hypothetical protein
MIRIDRRAIRALVAAAGVAAVVTIATLITGGFSLSIGGFSVRARNPVPPMAAAAVLAMAALAAGRGMLSGALAWWWTAIERHAAAAAIVLAAVTVYAGMAWGTRAAGGSDSYCYLNQAEIFARGAVSDAEPLATEPGWPGSSEAFVPAGHNASPLQRAAFVPICPAGYSLLLAGARLAGGQPAMFWVTPLMGGLLVVFAFVIGGQLARPAAGLFAALLTASSPIVLYQIVQPMNDVPAAALWAAAIAAALRQRGGALARGLTAGALTGIAVTIRPNLVPLAGVVAAMAMTTPNFQLPTPKEIIPKRSRFRTAWPLGVGSWELGVGSWALTLAAFSLAAIPGALIVMALQHAMHGSPFRSGYGDLDALFSASHVLPNLALYPRWVLEVHTPFVLLALAAPLVLHGRARQVSLWLLLVAAATLACYLPYVVFDAWWYQRFLLPAVAPLLALTAALAVGALTPLPPWARTIVFAGTAAALTLTYVETATARGVFGLRNFEARFRTAGAYVAALEPDAVVITTHHSGSVRFYSGRSTAAWDGIAPGRLSDAIAFLRARGRTPYLLIETWEQPAFRDRFAGDPLGSLEWPPMVEIDRAVRIYDPRDHARYMRGERVRTERAVSVVP